MGMVNMQAEFQAYVSVAGATVKAGGSAGNGRVGEKGGRGFAGSGRAENGFAAPKQDEMVKSQVGAVYEKKAFGQEKSVAAYDRSGKKTGTGSGIGNTVKHTAENAVNNARSVSSQKMGAAKSDYGEAVYVKTDPVSGKEDPNRVGAVNASQDYGKVIGAPELSEEGLKYYNELKEKYGNLDFVLVSKDMVGVAKSQLASYGNPNKMVVLIDEEKIERMATDKEYRKHYESIIAQAQNGAFLKRAVASSPSVKKAGINVLDNGAGSFMAACAKGSKEMNKKLEQKRAAVKAKKKETAKKDAKKKAEKAAEEKRKSKRIEEKKSREIAEKKGRDIRGHRDDTRWNGRDGVSRQDDSDKTIHSKEDVAEFIDNDDYEILYADSTDELAQKIMEYDQKNGFTDGQHSEGRHARHSV